MTKQDQYLESGALVTLLAHRWFDKQQRLCPGDMFSGNFLARVKMTVNWDGVGLKSKRVAIGFIKTGSKPRLALKQIKSSERL